MKKYASQVTQILSKAGIHVIYDKNRDLAYSLSESPFGDVYCVYTLEDGIISCFALYQPEVSPAVKEKVITYLDELNKQPGGGYFYIDLNLSRIVYCVDYQISWGIYSPVFETFCTRWFDLMKRYRQILYWLITGRIAKDIEPDIVPSMA